MPLIEILEVSHRLPAGESIERGAVESLKTGQLLEGEILPIEGWVVRRGGVASVEIDLDGMTVQRIQADRTRPDVEAQFPEIPGDGRFGFRTALAMTAWTETTISVWAAAAHSERLAIAKIRARRRWRENPALGEAPLVSIVILARAPSDHVGSAIESALAQSYPHLEVVVVGSGSVIKQGKFARLLPAVRVVESDGAGTGSAWNTGIRRTRGDFLLFLDDKEMLGAHAVERGLSTFRDHPESAAVFGHRSASAAKSDPTRTVFHGTGTGGIGITGGANSKLLLPLYRRSVFDSVGPFRARARNSEERLLKDIAGRFPLSCHHETVTEKPGPNPPPRPPGRG